MRSVLLFAMCVGLSLMSSDASAQKSPPKPAPFADQEIYVISCGVTFNPDNTISVWVEGMAWGSGSIDYMVTAYCGSNTTAWMTLWHNDGDTYYFSPKPYDGSRQYFVFEENFEMNSVPYTELVVNGCVNVKLKLIRKEIVNGQNTYLICDEDIAQAYPLLP